MKATLLIKNIANLYTCDSTFSVLHDAFIAVHHGRIFDMGIHDYTQYVEDCTRVLDARGKCVIPALIESDFRIPAPSLTSTCYKEHSVLHAMKRQGILTLLCQDPRAQRQDIDQEVLVRRIRPELPIISTQKQWLLQQPEQFLFSCAQMEGEEKIYSFHPLAYALYTTFDVDEKTLLRAMTSLPAFCFGLKDKGRIVPGCSADLLILNCYDLHEWFSTSGRNQIWWTIKRGIPVYPRIIRA